MKIIIGTILSILLISLISSVDAKDVCTGLTPANGTQIANVASCSKTALGQIPTVNHMTSTIITKPEFGQTLPINKNFTVEVKIINLHTGFFSNPETQYYSFSQTLDKNGKIEGHSHITVQYLGLKATPDNPPDPRTFAFFQGLNAKAVDGTLSQTLKLTEAGFYRICTMAASFSHQPLIMPVAKRGSQDDCIRIRISEH
ncbi:3446_t:CDS:1 [Scutellospora calospora]|uniref:3446_t:CDS:1 n=1 Tax=Scutellospora calospora TaxID=85575 RepID=A0ACA9N4K1_9GLOM|nr:3446_t:CDS:1 [Scutellospora calospora]